MQKILGAIRRADFDFNLISDGDIIGVGVSGGKDSVLLFHALHLYRFYSKKDFQIKGIHLKLGFPNMDLKPLIDFAQNNNYFLHLEETKIFKILQMYPNNNKICCSRCSSLKKGAVIKVAKSLNCNKVAFAHHGDDAVETLILNMIYGGKINTFAPKMFLSDQKIDFIRPFCYLQEDAIKKSLKRYNLPIVASTCPNDKQTKREEIKELLNIIYKKYPSAHTNFLNSLSDDDIKLWTKVKK